MNVCTSRHVSTVYEGCSSSPNMFLPYAKASHRNGGFDVSEFCNEAESRGAENDS